VGGGADRRNRASAAEGSPETPKPALRGSIRPGLGLVGLYAERVVHLGA